MLMREGGVDSPHRGMIGRRLLLDHLPQLRLRARDQGGIELVVFIPIRRIGLERVDHRWQRCQQRMARRPAQERPGAADVELIVIIGDLDHPGADEGIVRKHLVLDPGPCLDQGLGQGHDRPGLSMHEFSDAPLQRLVAWRLGLPEKKGDLGRQILPPVHDTLDRVDQVFEMQRRLAVRRIAGEEIARGLALVDAGDLLGKESGTAALVIDASRAQDHDRNRVALRSKQPFRLDLGLRIGPFGLERPVLRDRPSRSRGSVDEHRAGKDELFDPVELALQYLQETAGALHGHALVLGTGLAGEIVIRRQVNHRSEMRAEPAAYVFQDIADVLIRGQVNQNRRDAFQRLPRLNGVESDHPIAPHQARSHGLPQKTA